MKWAALGLAALVVLFVGYVYARANRTYEAPYPDRFGQGEKMVMLSRNRAHWVMADLAIISSGNVTVSMFTTLPGATADYIFELTQAKVLFVGETSNWDQIIAVLPEDILLVTLPGVELEQPHEKWEDLLAQHAGQTPGYRCQPDDMISLVFTSGTTGMPKGVIQTHNSNLIPIRRFTNMFGIAESPRYFCRAIACAASRLVLYMVSSSVR